MRPTVVPLAAGKPQLSCCTTPDGVCTRCAQLGMPNPTAQKQALDVVPRCLWMKHGRHLCAHFQACQQYCTQHSTTVTMKLDTSHELGTAHHRRTRFLRPRYAVTAPSRGATTNADVVPFCSTTGAARRATTWPSQPQIPQERVRTSTTNMHVPVCARPCTHAQVKGIAANKDPQSTASTAQSSHSAHHVTLQETGVAV